MFKMFRKNKTKAGFTLIELLVVIAIIGILASIVLASLNTARGKGNDAKVKAQLAAARSAAEVYYDTNGSYGTATNACDNMFADAASGMLTYSTVGNYPSGTTLTCRATSGASAGYSFTASLNTNNAATVDHWCVDSTGTSKAVADPPGAGDVTC